jgi:hypothetical protein
MQRLEQVNFAYAKEGCYRCGRGGPIVDMDTAIDGEGALGICVPCIGEAAVTAGLIKPRVRKSRRPA